MRKFVKKILNYFGKKRKRKTLLKKYGFKIVYKRDTSIVLGCFNLSLPKKNGKVDLLDDNGNILKEDILPEDADKYIKEYENAAQLEYPKLSKDAATKRYLDDLAESKRLRKSAYKKWVSKFEKKFHKHFDGEIIVRRYSNRDRTPSLWMQGGHNHLVNGKHINIKTIRKPKGFKFSNLPDDLPFIANVEMRFNNRFLPKKSTSSFFPKNWDITRIKEEIAYVYDDLVLSSKDFSKPPFKYIQKNSEGTFEILIEFDNLGNITNAYPNIKT